MTSKLSSATDLLLPGFKEQGYVLKMPQQNGTSLHNKHFDAFLLVKKKKDTKKKTIGLKH